MTDDSDQSESEDQETADEAMAELLGEEQVQGVVLPSGAHVLQMEDNPWIPPRPVSQGTQVAPQTTQEEPPTAGYGIGTPDDALVAEETSLAVASTPLASASLDEPETDAQVIARLPARWQRVYITELMHSGSPAEARHIAGGVSAATVGKAVASLPDFARLAAEATAARHERVDTALYRGATEGDEVPLVSQGAVVSSYRKRDTKAAEVYYRRHGLLADAKATVTHQGHVTTPDSDLPAQLLKVAEMLFGGQQPKTIEGKIVEEPDKG